VLTSIPLSILVSIIVLACLGADAQPDDVGGSRSPVGILVDDATVELENVALATCDEETHRPGHPRRSRAESRARVRGDALHLHRLHPRWCSSPARRARSSPPPVMAVVFAMMTSYLLSRTLVPTIGALPARGGKSTSTRSGWKRSQLTGATSSGACHERFNVHFERLPPSLRRLAGLALESQAMGHGGFGAFVVVSLAALFPPR